VLYLSLAQAGIIALLVVLLFRSHDRAARMLGEWARDSADERAVLVAQVQRPGVLPPIRRPAPKPVDPRDPPEDASAYATVGRVTPGAADG
jgi:hypothetical protein